MLRRQHRNSVPGSNEGKNCWDQERFEEAFQEAVTLDPGDSEAFYEKGLALAELGRYEEAIRAYDKALRLNPGDKDAYTMKGEALLALYPYIPPLTPHNGEGQ